MESIQSSRTWFESILPRFESAIDSLVNDFLQYPFRHRKEHSLHCELYHILAAELESKCIWNYGYFKAGIIQKEWPETVHAPNTIRGNFDISIIGPQEENGRKITINEFKEGLLRPAIVAEFGLDYGLSHLEKDKNKLINSDVQHGYLIHFDRRNHYEKTIAAIENKIDKIIELESITNIKIAYAYIDFQKSKIRYRKFKDDKIIILDLP